MALTNKGIALSKLKKYQEGLKCLDKVIEMESEDAEAWFNKGLIYKEVGNLDEADNSFNKGFRN